MKKVKFLGLSFDDIRLKNVLNWIEKDVGYYRYVITPNVDHVVRLHSNSDSLLWEIYKKADLTLCDSQILSLLSKCFGSRLNNVIPGSDLTQCLFETVIRSEDTIGIVGSNTKSFQKLIEKYNLKNALQYAPPMGFIENEEEVHKCIEFLKSKSFKYVFLAVGSPRQEILADLLSQTNCKATAFCIGASIDFLTGDQRRCPQIYRDFQCEWFYRFLKEPKRLFFRYFIHGPKIFYIILKDLLQNQR